MTKTYVIKDEIGLHARPVSILVGAASKFSNDMNITYNGKTVTLKSIIAVMSLAVPYNESIDIEVSGDDCSIVFEEIEKLLKEHNVI